MTISIWEWMLNNYTFTNQRSFFVLNLELPQKPDGEPVENLSKRHKADPKTKSTETAKARDEVQPSHLWQPLEFWGKTSHHWFLVGFSRIATRQIQLVLQRRCSQWRYHSRRHCSLLGPNSRVRFGLSYIWSTHLGERWYELSIAHGPWILWSQRPCCLVDVVRGQVPIGFQDAWLPHCQRGWGQVAEGAQVQVSRVAWTEWGPQKLDKEISKNLLQTYIFV